MFLDRIVAKKKEEVEMQKRTTSLLEIKQVLKDQPPTLDFKSAITAKNCAIIAEVKRSSPSKGRMIEDFRPVAIASLYELSGAAAISVLTEKHFFEGDGRYLSEIRQAVKIPLLRKDFILDPYQIYETKALGGDALLLIACLLDQRQLRDYIDLAASLGLASLVEVHDGNELEKAVSVGAELIGINNRNLQTFSTDIKTTIELFPLVPEGRIVVSESGIHSRKDIKQLMQAGVHAFLVGEVLIRSGNIAGKLRELTADA
jgi:indole-3-glycerol phosphate synthase